MAANQTQRTQPNPFAAMLIAAHGCLLICCAGCVNSLPQPGAPGPVGMAADVAPMPPADSGRASASDARPAFTDFGESVVPASFAPFSETSGEPVPPDHLPATVIGSAVDAPSPVLPSHGVLVAAASDAEAGSGDPLAEPAAPADPIVAEVPPPPQPRESSQPRQRLRFAGPGVVADSNIQISSTSDRISITAIDASLDAVLAMIAQQNQLNIVAGDLEGERISVTLKDVLLEDAFNAILAVKGFTWARHGNIVTVSSLSGDRHAASVQGRQVRVYNLNYVTAADVQTVVTGLLSPVGQVFIAKMNPADQRQTHEQLVVEDLPEYLNQVENYLLQADTAPRQVLVEAHVLQIALADDLRHGVNLEHLLHISDTNVTLQAAGFAPGSSPATMLRLDGPDLSGLIEAIKTTTDAKTLASPKVTVVNGQQARMQVGGQIGYLLTTTTQTSTLQSVNFLEVGVILTVTPIITDDGQVLMTVKPEVSTGAINPTTQLPESNTTQVETTVMLADGEAMVIGGLIQEEDNDSQNKIPMLGDIPVLGRLFQRRNVERHRNEIVIALLPRIISDVPGCRSVDPCQVNQARTPLFRGPLESVDRRHWEPRLPDAEWPNDQAPPRAPVSPELQGPWSEMVY